MPVPFFTPLPHIYPLGPRTLYVGLCLYVFMVYLYIFIYLTAKKENKNEYTKITYLP